jgi:hypothetical protein
MMKLTRWRKLAILTSIVVFIVGASTTASWALWSINDTASGSVTAGSVNLTANGSATTVGLATLTTAAEGAGSTQTQPVTLLNAGTLPLTYTTVFAATESLAAGQTGAPVVGDNIAYVAWIATSTTTCTASSTAVKTWTGTLNTGTTTWGTGRALAAGASEVLCIRTTMAASPPMAIIGQSVSATLTFTGTNS